MALKLVTQTELVNRLSEDTGFPKGECRHFLDALQGIIEDAIQNCERVKISGIQVEPKLKKATKKRKGRNPRTGEEVMIAARPASVVLKAKIVNPLKELELPSTGKLKKKLG